MSYEKKNTWSTFHFELQRDVLTVEFFIEQALQMLWISTHSRKNL